MADNTAIEWTDATWNPIRARNRRTGKIGWHCTHVSEGCRNCYAEGINRRLGTGLDYKPGFEKDIEIFLDEKMLLQPLRWKRPRMIFPGSMTDLFAVFVTDDMLDRIFAVMALTPQHTYQVLTKRSAIMQRYFNDPETPGRIVSILNDQGPGWGLTDQQIVGACNRLYNAWPLPNVWLGVSVEDQAAANERIPDLLATPAAIRFISAEPLLGDLDLTAIPAKPHPEDIADGRVWTFNALTTGDYYSFEDDAGRWHSGDGPHRDTRIDWIIAGGESGPKARPAHPDWFRSLRDQCADARVAFFFKQWGEHAPAFDKNLHPFPGNPWSGENQTAVANGTATVEQATIRVGKKAAGNTLDGRQHLDFPARQDGPLLKAGVTGKDVAR